MPSQIEIQERRNESLSLAHNLDCRFSRVQYLWDHFVITGDEADGKGLAVWRAELKWRNRKREQSK
jgi:hypothetical protein